MYSTLTELVQKAAKKLQTRGLKLITAESCTGGGLGFWLTSVSGSSAWFEGGFITYSNVAKIEMLGVDPTILEKYGAVSAEVAQAMAEGALKNSHAHISIAITGIAGPEGGSPEKPVGTVWFGLAQKNAQTITHKELFNLDRENVRLYSIATALKQIIAVLPG